MGAPFIPGPDCYGEIHVVNASIVVPIPQIDTWYTLPSGMSGSELAQIASSTGNSLTTNRAGIFLIMLSISVMCVGAPNQVISATYAINGVASPTTEAQTQLVQSGRQTSCACFEIVILQPGDTITIVLQNNSGANDLTVTSASLVGIRVP